MNRTHEGKSWTSHVLTNSQIGLLALGKDPSLGAHPHKSEGSELADNLDSRIIRQKDPEKNKRTISQVV